uniref:Uncharacterized protein n=1 Tax=Zea mays TaxID=4577 RepID=A0A804N331_MAIZE
MPEILVASVEARRSRGGEDHPSELQADSARAVAGQLGFVARFTAWVAHQNGIPISTASTAFMMEGGFCATGPKRQRPGQCCFSADGPRSGVDPVAFGP